ncbi:DUF4435 domain-containing protein [Nostoc sp. TCL26-01]|uniref:DUF4435 domain-containing protein n=1 Tax=Nostoc sp. TCL26-01 TaxID=2576904 RepID=UPI0015C15B61|nr:DUF4435 domain-containing protein [Nostoc sp. TCL26-01]QLE59099.1 DUF4435 domain-containing protein [Nostoc sp. TCL26-01]
MRDYLSVDREANAIRLRRSTFLGTFLLVEGSSDKIFYERFVDKLACALVSVSGKPSSKLRVIEVLNILERSNFQGVLAIVDADFDHLGTLLHKSHNLIRTDTHDLETMLLKSSALDKVITEFASEEKITKFDRDIRTALLEAGISIGYLLWISQIDGLNLTFDGLIFSRFIDEQTLQINEVRLIEEVKNKSQAFALKTKDLQKRLMEQKSSNHDPWQVCCGHDLVEILSLSLRKTIGSAKANDVEPNSLERNLRLAYEAVYFCKTQMYSSISIWESNNQPFKVLQNEL